MTYVQQSHGVAPAKTLLLRSIYGHVSVIDTIFRSRPQTDYNEAPSFTGFSEVLPEAGAYAKKPVDGYCLRRQVTRTSIGSQGRRVC